jgi:hypothetical protein
MWDNLFINWDLDWIAASIADNSCVTITDGSYMKDCTHISTPQHLFWGAPKAEEGLRDPSWSRLLMLVATKENF